MGAAEKINISQESGTDGSTWVHHSKITALTGFTYEQIKKYRQRGVWLQEKHWRFNPVGSVVYNRYEIDNWNAGKL